VKDTISSTELKEKAVDIARYFQKPRPEYEDDEEEDPDNIQNIVKRRRRDTIHRLLFQHKKHKDWSNLETNFKRELFRDGDLRVRKLNLGRKTLATVDEMRKSMAEFKREKKSKESLMNPYLTYNESSYSLAASAYSDLDSFTIYQRATYAPSVEYSTNQPKSFLKSALKKSKTEPNFNRKLNDKNIDDYGVENLSFIDDNGECRSEIMGRKKLEIQMSENDLRELDEEEERDEIVGRVNFRIEDESDETDENCESEDDQKFEMEIYERSEKL
jgi:hypothetical protein